MQKEANSHLPLKAKDGILLKHSVIHHTRSAEKIIFEAQNQAKKIVKQAYDEADRVRKEAYLIGYEKGLLTAVDALITYMQQHDNYVNELYQRLSEDLRDVLSKVIEDDDIVLHALKIWGRKMGYFHDHKTLHLLIPEMYRPLKPKMTELLAEKGVDNVSFEYHRESRFVMRYEGQLAEFCPEEIVENFKTHLLSDKDLYSDISKLSTEGIDALQACFSRYLEKSPVMLQDFTNGDE